MEHPLVSTIGLALFVGISATASASVVIDYVNVGNAGNAAGTTGYGAVAYEYKIAKNETTISQYAQFLNAVAKTDNYGLYSASMTTSYINGISRSGSSGSFTYSVNPGSGNKPITYVSWFDAARFCNWLQNGQQTGAGAALTAETGAYTLNGAVGGIITKNVAATVWIPSESEWYKAAYYDPTKNAGAGGYWLHANQSDTMTTNEIGMAGAANYYGDDYAVYYGSGAGAWAISDVGAYGANSDSYYGTNDQAGNVWEWNDAVISGSGRGMRGGAWDYEMDKLRSWFRGVLESTAEFSDIGFRVASAPVPVPEPSTIVLTMLFSAGLVCHRKR